MDAGFFIYKTTINDNLLSHMVVIYYYFFEILQLCVE